MRAGWLSNGRFVGLRLAFNQGGLLYVLGENGQTIFQIRKEAPDYSLAKVLDVVRVETARLETLDRNLLARFNVDWLRDVLVQWDQDPYGLMKRFTDDISGPMVANANAPVVDDPKTAGGGAVHPEELQRQAEEIRLANERHAENLRRIQENRARRQREKEEREARELQEMTEALRRLANTLNRK